jgi:hypothetical protein
MAEFDTPELADQSNWVARGYVRAICPDGMRVTRDMQLTGVHPSGLVRGVVESINPEQKAVLAVPVDPVRKGAMVKLLELGLTQAEIDSVVRGS